MSPADLIRAVERAGGSIRYRPPDGLAVELPREAMAELAPVLREYKKQVIEFLSRPPDGPCPAGHAAYWWRLAEDDPWHCGRCESDPRAAQWAGATLADLAGRPLVLAAPPGFPAIREWVRTPLGWGSVLAYSGGGGELFLRLFDPQPGQRPLQWVPTAQAVSEAAAEPMASDSAAQPRRRPIP